ncbi:MAG: T9SS C-terminal target domain-containing protein [Bacteroidetes bacterium]|nr:T9SS C-terminal target domain-containing protein [Bacteroidota bacterium]
MNLKIVLTALLLFSIIIFKSNATNISGTISTNTTLTSASSPYIVTSDLTVDAGVTLSIQSGVSLKFEDGFGLTVLGTLNATNTVFTSNNASPSAGKWSSIHIGNPTNKGIVSLSSCQLSYGQSLQIERGILTTNATNLSNFKNYGLYMAGFMPDSAIANITGSTFNNCGEAGIILNNADVSITSSTISNCNTPIRYDSPSSLKIIGTSNNFSGNTNMYVWINHNILDREMILPSINLPFYFLYGYTIYAGGRLQLSDGNILKFPNTKGINVYQGKLIANASIGSQIYFTSFKDDNLGGDANGDASATAPALNDWTGIDFPDAAIDTECILRRVTIQYADRGLEIDYASPTIDNCVFNYNYHALYITNASSPIISSNTFGSSGLTPIAMTFDANPVMNNLNVFSFQDNLYDAIGLIGGIINSNATLKIRQVTTSPNVTYVMLDDITIPSGLSLTINKGIVIKSPANINYQSNFKILVEGSLFANGTVDSNIVMTSVRDDNAGRPGDTNKDGTYTSPAVGDFGGIVFAKGSSNTSILNYCDIRFASNYQTYYSNQYQRNASVSIISANPTISNCKINNCKIGISCYQASNPTISNIQVVNCSSVPLAISVSANPVFNNITFTNAALVGLGIIGENVSVNGLIKKRTIANYTNITYVLLDNLTIGNGTNVEVENGVVIKILNSVGIFVDGGFKINGTPQNRIILTSVKDDNVGNPFDTNIDGNSSQASTGDWNTISFNPTSNDAYSAIRCTDIKFSGLYYNGYNVNWTNAVNYHSAAAPMDDVKITNSSYFGLLFDGDSNPIIDSVQIQNCTSDPIGMSLLSDPTFTNISFDANGSKGIQIVDWNLSSNALLKKRSLAGISNISYLINHLTIDANATLTLQSGVVVKSYIYNYYYYYYIPAITINGGLIAQGKLNEKIVFTSYKDDSYGGDYNNDGTYSAPDKDNWSNLVFNSSALNSNFKNCIFRYGGNSYNYIDGFIRLNSTNTFSMDSCVIEQSNRTAFSITGSASPIISNTFLANIYNLPVTMDMFSNPTFSNISLDNIRTIGLGIYSQTYSQNATIPIRNFAGYNNISYFPQGRLTINPGTTINIPASAVFKGGSWDVQGRLNVLGTLTSPVVFTTTDDDNYGNPADAGQDGQTQQNGIATFLNFSDISNDSSTIKNAIFKGMDKAVNMYSASPTFDSCSFLLTNHSFYLTGVSQPIINHSNFSNNNWPISTSVLSYPASTIGNTLSGNTNRGIHIINETLSQDVTLTKRTFAGIPNIPYVFDGFTIGTGATLTFAPGVVNKFLPGASMQVNRGLMALGGSTADSNIVFTSYYDDYYGGDTNADSNNTAAGGRFYTSNADWSGINIDYQALNSLCKFKNVIIKHADKGISMFSKNPIISNSIFRNNNTAISIDGASKPTINHCDFLSNGMAVNNVAKTFNIDASNCWWGENSGPTHASNPSGMGDAISDSVNYTPFRSIDAENPIMGDVSLNGLVQAYDAALVLQKSVNIISLNSIQSKVADVSGSSGITAFDGSLILQYLVDKIQTFPAEELFKTNRTPIPGYASLNIENKTAMANDTFVIPIHINKVDLAQSIDLQIQYDNTLLRALQIKNGSFAQGLSFNQNIDAYNGKLYISLASIDNLNKEGDFIYISFVSNSINANSIKTKLNVTKFLANETDMKTEVSGGEITINSAKSGIENISNLFVDKVYPNPSTNVVNIPITLSKYESKVNISVFSTIGTLVYSKSISNLNSGLNVFNWDGKSIDGNEIASGTYFICVSTDSEKSMQKLMITK